LLGSWAPAGFCAGVKTQNIEAPKALREVGYGEGVSLPTGILGEGLGAVPPPQNTFWICDITMVFLCILSGSLLFTVYMSVLHTKMMLFLASFIGKWHILDVRPTKRTNIA